ncbi:MAG: hypothetical protein IKA40_03315, partial [Clostridia bacterium]|nr:hypothetical protein [Clostridia bacterium]
MKTKMKNFLLVAFTALMMVVCALASVMLSPATVSASAEIAISMVDGAYIRVSETDSTKTGIAYQFEMSEEVYEAVEALKTTKDVYYGMVITKADSVKEGYELNEANLFGDEAKYTANPQEQSAEKPYFVNIMGDTLSAETETVDGTEVTTYYFTGRMYNIKQTNLTTKFVGLGYIRIQDKAEEGATSVEGEPEYIWATEGDNVRTVATVAENGLAAGEQDDTVKGYVTNAYKKLGIMDAESADKGTAAKPFVIDSEDKYEAFKTAYANDIVNGSNFYFQVNENVDYSHLATDFADRNFNFVYERATTNVIEDFNDVSTTAAAYNAYRGYKFDEDFGYVAGNEAETAAKKKQNPTAEYHDEFNGKFGVVSLKSTYYGVFSTGAGTDHTG